ncbi:MAG: DHH family phosphoesterase [Methylovulum sp.]|nr:DHH family phosphoesterase [Methylovulum sp.]
MNLQKDILVIYHADCLDGFGAAWSAFKAFGNLARYVAARFNEPFPKHALGCEVYILDFCYSPEVILNALETAQKITIIDHHLTAIAQFDDFFARQSIPQNLALHFDMNHSGCVLAWQHFFPQTETPAILLHIEDRDLWRFNLAGTQAITTALYEQMPLSFATFGEQSLPELLFIGGIQAAQFAKMINRLGKSYHQVVLAGEKGFAVNAPSFFASELGHVLAQQSGTFGMTYQYDGKKRQWLFALRSVGTFNVGRIAQGFGGGGHVNAAGFTLPDNPFLPSRSGFAKKSKKRSR